MKMQQALLMLLFYYANCQGASKSIALNPAGLPVVVAETVYNVQAAEVSTTALVDTKVHADKKRAADGSNKLKVGSAGIDSSVTTVAFTSKKQEVKSSLLLKQESDLRDSLDELVFKDSLSIIKEYLYSSQYGCEVILEGHTNDVKLIIELKDGRLASCSYDDTIRIWGVNPQGKYECEDILECYNVHSIIQLADGRLASSSSYAGTIHIWDLSLLKGDDPNKDKRCVAILMHSHIGNFFETTTQLADGKLCTYCSSGRACIWDLNELPLSSSDGEIPVIFCKSKIGFNGLSNFKLKDGRTVDFRYNIRIAELWPATNELILYGHKGFICSVIQLKDGRLASCSDDQTIRIWDLSRPKERECVAILYGHTDRVKCIIQLSDGRLASCSLDGTIRIWNQEKDSTRLDLPYTFPRAPISDSNFLSILTCFAHSYKNEPV